LDISAVNDLGDVFTSTVSDVDIIQIAISPNPFLDQMMIDLRVIGQAMVTIRNMSISIDVDYELFFKAC